MMSEKRILFLHNEFPSGGAERVTIDIADYVSAYGYTTYVLAKDIRNIQLPNIVVIELPDKQSILSKENADAIIHILNELCVDIFVLPVQTLPHLEYIRNNTQCKVVFALHSAPFWEIICGLYYKKKQCWHSFLKRMKWFLLIYPKTVWLKRYHKRVLNTYERVYQQVDAYTVLCEGYKQLLIEKMQLPPKENRLHVIPNSERGVERVNLHKKKQVLFVGRMSYEDKRVDRLIDIWEMIYKKAPDWELILVGDGPEREFFQRRAERKRLQRITFVGHSNRVADYYRDASVLCLTSNFEGWPLCLTEAQANGVVPVAFDCVAGVREIISPSGENGVLVSSFKLKDFARELLALLNDSERLQEMRDRVILKSKEYAPEIVGDKWLNLFNSLN